MIMRKRYKSLKQFLLVLLLFACSVVGFTQGSVDSRAVIDLNGSPVTGVKTVINSVTLF